MMVMVMGGRAQRATISGGTMAAVTKNERLDVRLPREFKAMVEQAASQLGQSVSAFVVATVTRRARKVLREQAVIALSERDRDRFLAALDDEGMEPSPALLRAAERHSRLIG
jgi:uncharacterized protein (DUF1778 family)